MVKEACFHYGINMKKVIAAMYLTIWTCFLAVLSFYLTILNLFVFFWNCNILNISQNWDIARKVRIVREKVTITFFILYSKLGKKLIARCKLRILRKNSDVQGQIFLELWDVNSELQNLNSEFWKKFIFHNCVFIETNHCEI